MSNMSYCRFRNTNEDFTDCVEALREMECGHGGKLDYEEMRAAQEMLNNVMELAAAVAAHVGSDVDEVDEDDVENFMIEMNCRCEEEF